MEELIKITRHNGKKVVSARDLHDYLECGKDFSSWIKHRISKYGFSENLDYTVLTQMGEPDSQRVKIEYALTLDMAKELGMLEGNDKGREIRKYFIKIEKQAQADFTPIASFEDHMKHQIQKLNSKEVNTLKYEEGGVKEVIQYNIKNCILHTGQKPKDIKKKYAKSKLPAKVKQSAKEIIRMVYPITSCAMSLTDNLVKMGGNHNQAAEISNNHGRKVFEFMIQNKMIPGELFSK
jgi:phage anti-repressor protein